MCRTMIDRYLDTIGPAGLIPTERADAELLLDVYALQKCLYEVRYELANRPEWVHWPLAAAAEMIRR
jgi:maltose alpha-D-glucosyltransferase/alpha-amylase